MQPTRRFLLALPILAAGLAALAPTSLGQTGQPSPALSGTWQLEGSVDQAESTVQHAIAPAVVGLTPDIERLARARLAESTWVPQTIHIQAATDHIHIELVGAEQRTFDAAPGQTQNVFSRSGVRAQLTQTYRPDGGIQQQFRAVDGTQYNFLIPEPGGQRLNLDVLMESRRLASEVRFRLTYRKQR